MFYSALSLGIIASASLVIPVSLWILVRKSWLVAWLKASLTFMLVAFAGLLLLLGTDLYRYQSYRQHTPIAQLSVKQLDQQVFETTLTIIDGGKHKFVLKGDMWQLDARLITWSGPLVTYVGATPGYRLERISGRYHSLEQARKGERTVFGITDSLSPFDFFAWLQKNDALPWVDAKYGSAAYLPLTHGAEYAIAVGTDGLVARPINSPAMDAVESWQ